MRDSILDFIEDHRILVIVGIVVVILVGILFGIRTVNGKKKAERESLAAVAASEEASRAEEESIAASLAQDQTEEVKPTSEYIASLGLGKGNKEDERVEVTTEAETEPETTAPERKAKYPPTVDIFDWTAVPKKNMDGSSCKAYQSKVKLADFGTFWGTALTEDDFNCEKRILVGVDQNPDDFQKGDLQSEGWLIQHMGEIADNDCVRFTNLHVIGSLSDDHVALLCSYDWYSAFGLKDTLVVFEDISGTLKTSDFKDGDVFSASVYGHNLKVEKVGGYNVVCAQYAVFE